MPDRDERRYIGDTRRSLPRDERRFLDDRVAPPNNPPPFDFWENLGAPFRGLAPAWEGIGRTLREIGQGIGILPPSAPNVPAYTGPLVSLTNDETQRRYETPLVRLTNDRTRPTKERSMAYTGPAAPEQAYAPEFFGPTSPGGGQLSAMSPGYAFPEWEGYQERDRGGGYGRANYGPGRANYGPGYGGYVYEQPKPPAPRRYDYGLTSWRF